MIKKIIACFFISTAFSANLFSQSQTSSGNTAVNVFVKHAVVIPDNVPGFQLWVQGWEPSGNIEITLVDANGETFNIIPRGDNVKADSTGTIWLEIPYDVYNWASGVCIITVAGPIKGVHILETEIPTVSPPNANNSSWSLGFINSPSN